MHKGSGIATYARNLNIEARNLGYDTCLIYGPRQGPSRDDLMNEIALYDAPPPKSRMEWVSASRRSISNLTSAFGRTAKPLRATTKSVITRQVAQNAPAADSIWVARNLFAAANQTFGMFGATTPLTLGSGGPDIMHWTCPLPIRAKGVPNLYTIHDLVPLRLPFATLDNKRRFLQLSRKLCAVADKVVTVSEASKSDIIQILGVAPDRVSVTHQSVSVPQTLLDRSDDEVAREIEGVFGLDWRGYLVFFGAVEPKKNLGRIIEAYLASGVATPLIIVGGKAWLDDAETQLLYEDIVEIQAVKDGLIRRADRIRRYEYLPFSLLVSLIRGARATLLPSLYEGFGLPVLESMLLGTPVLTSTEGSLPEVAGDAAVLVDPYDSHAIARAIRELDGDADLRADLSRRGVAQAAKFSPEVYRRKLADLYKPFH